MTANRIISGRFFQHSFHHKSQTLPSLTAVGHDSSIANTQQNSQHATTRRLGESDRIDFNEQIEVFAPEMNIKEYKFPIQSDACTDKTFSSVSPDIRFSNEIHKPNSQHSHIRVCRDLVLPAINNTDHLDHIPNSDVSGAMDQFSAMKMTEPSNIFIAEERTTSSSCESIGEETLAADRNFSDLSSTSVDLYTPQKVAPDSESHSVTSTKLPSVPSSSNTECNNNNMVSGNAMAIGKAFMKRARSRLSQNLRRRVKKERRKKSSEKKKTVIIPGTFKEPVSLPQPTCLATSIQPLETNQRIESLHNDLLVTKPSDLKERLIRSKNVYKNHSVSSDKVFLQKTNHKSVSKQNDKNCLVSNSLEVHNTPINRGSTKRLSSHTQEELEKVVKVYLSEAQSGVITVSGMEFPCAPPSTPMPDHMKHYKYIPSLTDNKAQRTMKSRLQALEKAEHKKSEKRKDEQLKMEKMYHKNLERELKQRQRLEVYALNKVMTELENKRFQEFCKAKGINP